MHPPNRQLLASLLVALLLAVAPTAQGQPAGAPAGVPYPVHDLPVDGLVPLATDLAGLDAVETADRLLITARQPGEQLERGWLLWATDGTPAGSAALLDPPAFLAPVAATDDFALLFEGVGATGLLWITDGTVAGTRSLGIDPGRVGQGHGLGDQVVFLVTSGDDEGIWITDGTAAGTRLLARAETDHLELADAVEVDGRLVFDRFAPASAERPGLWVTDGTGAGTFPIVAPAQGGELRAVTLLSAASPGDGPAFFAGRTAERGLDLYVTDGTVVGTRLAADIEPGPGDVRLLTPVVHEPSSDGWYVVAAARRQPADLWRVGPGSGGGRVVSDLDAQGILWDDVEGGQLAVHDGHLVLAVGGGLYAHDRVPGPVVALGPPSAGWRLAAAGMATDLFVDRVPTDGGEVEIWTTDGTPGGTGLYDVLCSGACSDGIVAARRNADGDLLATVLTSPEGVVDLFRLTRGGPVALTAFEPRTRVESFVGQAGADTVFRVETEGARADPFDGSIPTISARLWSTDGTPGGTGPLPPLGLEEPEPGSIVEMVPFADGVAFTVQDPGLEPRGYFYPTGRGQFLYLSDGTPSGDATRQIHRGPRVPPYALTGLFDLTPQGDRLVFLGIQAGSGDPPTWEVLAADADGSVESLATRPVADFGSTGEEIIGLVGSGDRVYLQVTEGFRLLAPGADTFGPLVPIPWTRNDRPSVSPVRLGESDLFATAVATDGPDSWQLVATDGTPAGTRILAEDRGGEITSLVRLGGRAWFVVQEFGIDSARLWVSDGTVAGTRESSAFGEPRVNIVGDLFVGDDVLYGETFGIDFSSGIRNVVATGLRATDGTAASAVQVHDGRVWAAATLGDRLLFVSATQDHGRELWISDGTPAGTGLLADLRPGPGSSDPDRLLRVGSVVYFTAFDPATGVELWFTDGTAGGTRRVADLTEGVRSSTPDLLTVAGERLYFESAGSVVAGRELFALPIAPAHGGGGDGEIPPRPDTPPLTSPAVPGFRFWVEITPQGLSPIAGSPEPACIPETVCVSGALDGRTEAFLRVIGPRPNGLLWPVITRFTPSRVEVWIEQASSGDLRYYDLPATDPEGGDLSGLFDRNGFTP